jgi:chromosome segregation ATPase
MIARVRSALAGAVFTALTLVVATPMVSTLRAQAPPTAAVGKQELAESKFRELTDRMEKLMTVLQKDEPDDSKLLGAGLRYVQEKKLHQRLDHAGGQLRQEKWTEALVEMSEIKADLATLLELLQNRNADLRELLERIDQLTGFRDRVDDLIKEQQAEKEASARTEALQQHLEDIEARKQRAEQLLAQKKALRAETNQLPLDAAAGMTEPLAEREGELKKDTDDLAKDLANLEKKDAELKKEGEPAAGKPEAGKPGEPGKPSAGQPGSGSCSGSAGKAAQSMQKAQQQLGDKKPESSLKDQDQAVAELERAIDELEAMAEDARRDLLKLPFDQQAKAQEKTQHATDTLSKDMEQAEQGDENSEGEPTPGKNKVQQAVPKQRAAAGQLKDYVPAKQKQQDAKDDLEAAKKELEDALAQLRQQLQDEVLRALEERFTAMLAKQRELTIQTKTVDETRGRVLTASGGLPAALVQKIETLAGGETDLELEAIDALKLLEEDGTTAVFPPMVEQLRDELNSVAAGLGRNETGADMNQAQRDVEDLLELLINSLRRTIEQKEGGH